MSNVWSLLIPSALKSLSLLSTAQVFSLPHRLVFISVAIYSLTFPWPGEFLYQVPISMTVNEVLLNVDRVGVFVYLFVALSLDIL